MHTVNDIKTTKAISDKLKVRLTAKPLYKAFDNKISIENAIQINHLEHKMAPETLHLLISFVNLAFFLRALANN